MGDEPKTQLSPEQNLRKQLIWLLIQTNPAMKPEDLGKKLVIADLYLRKGASGIQSLPDIFDKVPEADPGR